jgi:hypothetical protein
MDTPASDAASSARALSGIAGLLTGVAAPWESLGVCVTDVVDACRGEEVVDLVFERLSTVPNDWPPTVADSLADAARADIARELLRHREIVSVLDALAKKKIRPVLLKGTALAYTVYSRPSSRPREDTDLIVPRGDVEAVRGVMESLGYFAPKTCDGELLLCQFPMRKEDVFGVRHAFDIHWKISTQSVFADALTYEELAVESIPAPALGPSARVPSPLHALLLACIHPVMHHRNSELLIWQHDIHLLVARLCQADLDRFVDLAVMKRVAAVIAHQLRLTQQRLGTRGLASVIARLEAARPDEASAAYLDSGRRWRHELASNIRGLTRWSDKLKLIREVALPGSDYVLSAYGFRKGGPGIALLPLLYCLRILRGTLKIAAGRK